MRSLAGAWNERVVPRLVDASLKAPQIGELRDEVCAGLSGRVLKIGFGSGLNLRSCPGAVTEVHAVEPSDLGWQLAQHRRDRSRVPVERVGLDGQRLDVADADYDAVLITFTLCTVPDPDLVLGEAHRALRPDGRLHLLEHGRSPDPGVHRWQRRLEPLQRRLAGGCHLTRDVPEMLRANRFEPDWLRSQYLLDVRLGRAWNFGYLAVARPV